MISKTIKWVILSGAVLGGTGYLLFGTAFPSYLGTVASSAREAVAEQIPLDLELKRAAHLIQEIDPQIESCKRDLARSEVELEELQRSVRHLEESVEREEKQLKTGARMLSTDGDGLVALAANLGTRRRMEAELLRTKDNFINNSSMLKTKRTLIERQSKAVEAARQRLAAVRNEREVLADQVASLKTQQQQVEALAATSHRFDLDSTALSQAKEVIAKVKKRLDVAQRMLENDMVWEGVEVAAAPQAPRDVVAEIQQLFAPAAPGLVPQIEPVAPVVAGQ